MIELVALGSAVGSAAFAAATTAWVARKSRARVEQRLAELESELVRERASARRKLAEHAAAQTRGVGRLRRALGLPDGAQRVEPIAVRRLPDTLRERLAGLVEVSSVVVADDTGLAWTREDDRADAGLAAACAAVLGSRLAGQRPRLVHVELTDARHAVIAPIAGTSPAMAIAVASTSRPVAAFALDAVLAYAAEALGIEADDPSEPDPLSGHATDQARATSPLGGQLLSELAAEVSHAGQGMLAIGVGDELLAAHGSDGPPSVQLAALHAELRMLMDRIGHRMRGRVRRLDWASESGSTASAVSLGASGRSVLVATTRGRRPDSGSFDRLAGRLRRMLPNDAPRGITHTDEARRA